MSKLKSSIKSLEKKKSSFFIFALIAVLFSAVIVVGLKNSGTIFAENGDDVGVTASSTAVDVIEIPETSDGSAKLFAYNEVNKDGWACTLASANEHILDIDPENENLIKDINKNRAVIIPNLMDFDNQANENEYLTISKNVMQKIAILANTNQVPIKMSHTSRINDCVPKIWATGDDWSKAFYIDVDPSDLSNNENVLKEIPEIDLSNLDVSNVRDMSYMFHRCYAIKSLDLSGWNTNNVQDMSYMFDHCTSLKDLDFGNNWSTSHAQVKNMEYMFSNCEVIPTDVLNNCISKLNTKDVTNMGYMFSACQNVNDLDLSGFNTGEVTNMEYMFNHCTSLNDITFGQNWNTSKVTTMKSMFYNTYKLEFVDLTKFNTQNCSNFEVMFRAENTSRGDQEIPLIIKTGDANLLDGDTMGYTSYGRIPYKLKFFIGSEDQSKANFGSGIYEKSYFTKVAYTPDELTNLLGVNDSISDVSNILEYAQSKMSSEIEIADNNYDFGGWQLKSGEGLNGEYSAIFTDSWSYSVSGNKIVRTKDSTTETIELFAPEHKKYGDGNPSDASVTNTMTSEPTIITPAIEYYKDDSKLTSAPEDAGTYEARVTMNLDGTNYTAKLTYEVGKADLVQDTDYTLPQGQTKSYNGQQQSLATGGGLSEEPLTNACTMEYSLDNGSTWYEYKSDDDTKQPKGQDAGDYTIKFRIKGTENVNDLDLPDVNSEITKAELIENTDYTFPTGINGLVYNGNEQGLIESGSITNTLATDTSNGNNYKIQYKFNDIDWTDYDVTNPPVGRNAGVYKIYLRIIDITKGLNNGNFKDVTDKEIEIKIDQRDIPEDSYTLPYPSEPIYNGNPLTLLEGGNLATYLNGHFEYKVVRTNPDEYWMRQAQATDAGNYAVYVKIVSGNSNYKDLEITQPISAKIKKAQLEYELPEANDLTYTGAEQNLVKYGQVVSVLAKDISKGNNYAIQYSLDGNSWIGYDISNPPKDKNAGKYQISFRIIDIIKGLGNGNFEDVLDERVEVEIKKAVPVEGQDYTLPTAISNLVYNGEMQTLLEGGIAPEDAEFQYKINPEMTWWMGIAEASDAGEYDIVVGIKESSNYEAVDNAGTIKNKIAKAELVENTDYTLPTGINGLVYNGNEQNLIENGNITNTLATDASKGNNYKIQYKFNDKDWTDYDASNPPTGRSAGKYQISFKIIDIAKGLGSGNFEDVLDERVEVEIKKAVPVEGQDYTLPTGKEGLIYNGSDQLLLNDDGILPEDTVGAKFGFKLDGSENDWSETIPTGLSAGEYKVKVKIIGGSNYNDQEITNPIVVKISKANLIEGTDYTWPFGVQNLKYTGQNQALLKGGQIITELPQKNCKLKYSFDGNNWNDYGSANPPVGNGAMKYTLYLMIDGGNNYNSVTKSEPIIVEISNSSTPSGGGGGGGNGGGSYDVIDGGSSSATSNTTPNTGFAPRLISSRTLSDIKVPDELKTKKYINGYEDKTFKPEQSITRAEVAQAIYKLINNGESINYDVLARFSDVETGKWYSKAIAYLAEKNIVNGSDGKYNPDNKITRAETAQILINVLKSYDPGISSYSYGSSTYNFNDVTGWSEETIKQLASNGMVNGYIDNTFKPNDSIKRSEFVAMLAKVFGRNVNKTETMNKFSDVHEDYWAAKFINDAAENL